MRIRTSLVFSTLAFTFAALAACGGHDYGPDPDAGDVEGALQHPTGALGADNASQVLGVGRASVSQAGVTGLTPAGARAGARARFAPVAPEVVAAALEPALRGEGTPADLVALGSDTSAGAFAGGRVECAALGRGETSATCDCPAGGTFAYELQGLEEARRHQGDLDVRVRFRFDACAFTAGGKLDGTLAARGTASAGDPASAVVLLRARLTATASGQEQSLALDARVTRTEVACAVDLGQGSLALRAPVGGAGGNVTVRDRSGTWDCVVDARGAGVCTTAAGRRVTFD